MIPDLINRIKNVDFEITFNCNLRCLHCYNESHVIKNEVSLDKIKSTINEIKEVGFTEIHITGGEPLIHPKILEILAFCNALELDVLLETNAVLLTRAMVDEIKNFKNVKIRASIDGSREIHNKIRRSTKDEDVYQIVVSNLEFAVNSGIVVQVTCSVNKLNYNSIYDLVKDLYKHNIKDLRLRLSMPASFGYVHWQILKMEKDDFALVKKQIQRISTEFQDLIFNASTIIRSKPNLEPKFFITPQGLVKPYPFIEYYVGDIHKESIQEILNKFNSLEYPKKEEEFISTYLKNLEGLSDE